MRVVLTELEKTILLAFLTLARGIDKYISEQNIVSKFPVRRRKNVERFVAKLVKDRLLIKHPAQTSYKLSEDGLRHALKLLHEGAKLWSSEK